MSMRARRLRREKYSAVWKIRIYSIPFARSKHRNNSPAKTIAATWQCCYRAPSRKQWSTARSDWLAARANAERARNQQDFMKLVAPSAGVVIKRDGEIGELVPVNQPVFW